MDRKFGTIMLLLLACSYVFGTDVGQCWIAAAVGAGLGVLSSLYGGSKASKEAKKAERELRRSEAMSDAWYSRRYNQGYADTAAGQSLLTRARDMAQENWKRAEGARRVAGMSSASADRAKEQGLKMVGNAIGQLAVNDTARKDATDAAHRADQKAFAQQRVGIHNQRAANISAAASQASNALISAGAAVDGAIGAKGAANQAKAASSMLKTPGTTRVVGGNVRVPTIYDTPPTNVTDPTKWMFEGLTLKRK